MKFGITLLLLLSSINFSGNADDSSATRLKAVDYVLKIYKHGLPYAEARKYAAEDVPALINVLSDAREEKFWANTVLLLGIIGTDEAVTSLKTFLETRFTGEVSIDKFNALLSVLQALGHAASRGNSSALKYLLSNSLPEQWSALDLRWKFKKYEGEKLHILLSKLSMQGLALSCRPEARELLLKMRDSKDETYVSLRKFATDDIRECIESYDTLSKEGHEKVLKYREP